TTSGIADGEQKDSVPRARVPAMHRRRQMRQEVEGRVDEREMRERLGKVAEQALRLGVVLLCKQADVVREPHEPLEERARLFASSGQHVTVDEPERERQED